MPCRLPTSFRVFHNRFSSSKSDDARQTLLIVPASFGLLLLIIPNPRTLLGRALDR